MKITNKITSLLLAGAITLFGTATAFAAESELLLGDVNSDSTISVSDATLLQKYIADLVDLSDEQLKVADFDQDGTINISDVTAIQNILYQYRHQPSLPIPMMHYTTTIMHRKFLLY